MPRRWLWVLPLIAFAITAVLALPARLSFHKFLMDDVGSSLATTLLVNRGAVLGRDLIYPYGPVTLAAQQVMVGAMRNGPLALTVLALSGCLAFAAAMAFAIAELELGGLAAALLTIAAALVVNCGFTPPVYGLEIAALGWALALYARGWRGAALGCCVAGAWIKPSMAYVLGALLVVEAVAFLKTVPRAQRWRSAGALLKPPLLTALILGIPLALHFGLRTFWALMLPLAGMHTYGGLGLGHAFFSRGNNPFLAPGERLGYFLGTGVVAWAWSVLVLACGLAGEFRPRCVRWRAAGMCLAATVAFVLGFYASTSTYYYYIALPLIGCALLPRFSPRWLATVAVLSALGMFSTLRANVAEWRTERRVALADGLWATPAEAGTWARLRNLHLAGGEVVFLLNDGSPESVLPEYGPPWHGFMVPGLATAVAENLMAQRLANASCVVVDDTFDQGWLSPDAGAAFSERQSVLPRRSMGERLSMYGCR